MKGGGRKGKGIKKTKEGEVSCSIGVYVRDVCVCVCL